MKVETENSSKIGDNGLESPLGQQGFTAFICFLGLGVMSGPLQRGFTSISSSFLFVLKDNDSGIEFYKKLDWTKETVVDIYSNIF